MFESLFSHRGLSLDRLRVLVEIADAGSIAKAAGPDTTRQSQYSRQLKELESFVGVELAQRDGKNLKVSAAGRRLAAVAREHLIALEEFVCSARHVQPALRAGAGDSLIQWLLLPRLGREVLSFQVHLSNLTSEEIATRILDSRLDLGLIRKDRIPAGVRHERIGVLKYALFVPAQVAPTAGSAAAFFKAAGPFAALDASSEITRRLCARKDTARFLANALVVCDSFTQAFAAVQTERFAAILPTLVESQLPAERFRKFEWSPLDTLKREIHLVWHPRLLRIRSNSEKSLPRLLQVLHF